MIEAIKEINFPSYATLSKATVTLNDMGDRIITTDIKIDGNIVPDFSYDWEIEFKGERYIHPLKKPQASKDNNSFKSTISLTFYHWAEYQLKRDFFVELASTQAGTAFADKYIAPLSVNLGEFVIAFNNVLSYYFPDGKIYAELNPDWNYELERTAIELNYSYLWDVLQKTNEIFGVRWHIQTDKDGNYAIRFGYPTEELTHIFEYGFNGGLLKIERQVQDTNIRNKILGRGGSQNLPYLYFKDYDKYSQGGDGNQGMIPDPDAIPELNNIFFSELRDSNFRSYVQGWKTNPARILVDGDSLDEFDQTRAESDYAYLLGATDDKFNPVEFVKDDESIAKYGELVGKLDNNEDIYPSLQGMEIEITSPSGDVFSTRADEIVAVQEVVTDSVASDEENTTKSDIKAEMSSSTSHHASNNTNTAPATTITVSSSEIEVPEGYEGTLFDAPTVKYTIEFKERIKKYMQYKEYYEGDKLNKVSIEKGDSSYPTITYKVVDVISNKEVNPVNVPEGKYRIDYTLSFPAHSIALGIVHAQKTPTGLGQTERVKIHWLKRWVNTSATMVCKSFNGDVVLNKVNGISISKSVSVGKHSKATVSITGDSFTVPEQGAIMVDVPISVTPAATTTYSEKTIKVIKASTNEVVPASNIPAGNYKLLVDVTLTNDSSSAKDLKVELLPAYLYFADNTETWEPTFDVWIKNIFNTKKSSYLSEAAYVEGVWSPLRTDQDMAVTFSSGNLSGHDSWEFRVKKDGIAYDNSKVIIDANGNEVRSEWRLTLIKSDAELETIKKYVPYKGFNAAAGDMFFFTGIYLPHQYVLSAEKELTNYKQDNLAEVKDIKPQWVVSIDKVRAQQEDAAGKLIDKLSPGAIVTIRDKRLIGGAGERQILQSVTYEWQEGSCLPNVDVVLSDKITTSLSTVSMLQGKVEALSRQVGGLSNLEQIIRKIGDLLYLRKDGFEDESFSPTKFAYSVSSNDFNPGAIGGLGWGIYKDENGQSVIEADKLFVRNEMQVNSLIINQIAALGGTKILSAADITITAVEPVSLADGSIGDRCFFDTKGASKANLFMVNDIAYSNMFDSENVELKYYKRKVVEVGEDYITLSTTEGVGEGTPQEGDVIVQFGNFTDATRQSFVVIDPLNGGKIEVFSGVNSFDTKDCNKVGMGVDPSTNEAFLYGYGDMFLGDRNLKDNYITFQKRKGDTEKKLFINADIQIGAGSSGLSNLSEWAEKQVQIDDAQNVANEATRKAQQAQSEASSATSKLTEWADDNIISPVEKQELKNEISFIKADYDEIYNRYVKYIQEFDVLILSDGKQYITSDGYVFNIEVANNNWIGYESAYRSYLSDLEEKVSTSSSVPVGNLVSFRSAFYSKRTAILDDISLAIKAEADYAVKRANTAISDAEAARAYVDVVKKELLDQIDGAITNWFGESEPTLNNYPANEWITDADKDAHLGDLYYSGEGKVYRFQKNETGAYEWRYIPDNDLAQALELAQKAQDTADGKRRIFIAQPYAPYDKGDLWAGGENLPLKVCHYPKIAGEPFSESDWVLADNTKSYVDTSVDAVRTLANNAQATANSANARMNEWAADNVISPVEKRGLKDEIVFVTADYNDISLSYEKYIQEFDMLILQDGKQYITEDGYVFNVVVANANWDAYIQAYRAYMADLQDKTADTNVIPIGNLASLQRDYYDARTVILEDISLSIKAEADYSKKTAQKASQDVQEVQKEVADYEYLKSAFGQAKSMSVQGVVMSQMVAVADVEEGEDATEGDVKAFLNGSDFAEDLYEHGKLILAGGIPSGTDPLSTRAQEATTRIYEDGFVVTNNLKATGGEFENVIVRGSFASKFDEGGTYLKQKNDNYVNTSKSSTIYIQLGYDISQSGRRMTFVGNYGLMCSNGYIYDRGTVYYHKYMETQNEIVTLIAVPTSATKVCWIVESRHNIGW